MPQLRHRAPRRHPESSTAFSYDLSDGPEVIDLTGEDGSRRPSHRPATHRTSANGLSVTDLGDANPQVDLGDASRGPRFANAIIDLVADSSPTQSTPQQQAAEPSSPDVQFIRSRRLPTPHPPLERRVLETLEPPVIPDFGRPRPTPLADSMGPMDQFRRNLHFAMGAMGSVDQLLRRSVQLATDSMDLRRSFRVAEHAAHSAILAFEPTNLDFMNVGFELATDDLDFASDVLDLDLGTLEESSATDATYQAPPTPPEGFTRTPVDNDVLICPNCSEELCEGEDDVKKQVWAVKGCGHVRIPRTFCLCWALTRKQVYCGECAVNRFKTKRRNMKTPPRGKTFKECVVDGCMAKTTHKAMFQLYI
jgi:hypothetical protein